MGSPHDFLKHLKAAYASFKNTGYKNIHDDFKKDLKKALQEAKHDGIILEGEEVPVDYLPEAYSLEKYEQTIWSVTYDEDEQESDS